MAYLCLKAIHVAAVLCWIGGLLTAAVTIAAVSAMRADPAAPGRTTVVEVVRSWERRVTLPAMLVAWGAGLVLAMQGQWFGAPWLTFKLALVLALSALYGVLSGTLRRLAGSDAPPLSWLQHAPLFIIGGVTAIVVLVIVKPF